MAKCLLIFEPIPISKSRPSRSIGMEEFFPIACDFDQLALGLLEGRTNAL